MTERIYILMEGQVAGPLTQEEVQQLLRQGRLQSDAPAKFEHGTTWATLNHLVAAMETVPKGRPNLPPLALPPQSSLPAVPSSACLVTGSPQEQVTVNSSYANAAQPVNDQQPLMKSYYYIDSTNQTKGPHSIEELDELARSGVIKADTMIAADGDPHWKPFRTRVEEKPPRPIAEILKKAANAFQQFATDPVGGMPDACKGLDNSSAVGVGITFCAVFVGCFYVFAGILPPETFKQLPMFSVLLAATVPFVCLTAASFLTRSAFRGAGNLGSDCFIAGAALLPTAFLLALIRLLGVRNIEVIVILAVFAECLTVLMLYTGCHRICGLTERTATFAVPVMLIANAWLVKIVYTAWIQPSVPALTPYIYSLF